jgi:hypothetical protein
MHLGLALGFRVDELGLRSTEVDAELIPLLFQDSWIGNADLLVHGDYTIK